MTRLAPWLLLAAGLAVIPAAPRAAHSQEATPGQGTYASWSQVEAAKETRDYKEKLRDGGPVDATAEDYLTRTALPQLGLEANRRTIDRVRRRIRELLLTDITDENAFKEAAGTVRDFMLALAGDPQADPAVRLNAMLLVGELKARDGKPWPATVAPLATAAVDAKLPMVVRLAAVAGLARHADAARMAAADAAKAFAENASPMAVALVTAAAKPPEATPRTVETAWMTSRALTILPVAVRQAPKNVAATLVAIINDGSWPIDLRVRAANALATTATAESGLDAAQAIEAIRRLALAALQEDVAAAERRRGEQSFAAAVGGPPAGAEEPAAAPAALTIAEQAARRDAWRIATLADAILAADGKSGLAKLFNEANEAAAALATTLRRHAAAIDEAPNAESVMAAVEEISRPAAAAPPQPAPAAATPEAPAPASGPERPESPFEASPFGQ